MHPLDGARCKIDRSLEHLNTLDAETTAYVRENSYRLVGKYYAKTCHKTFRFALHGDPPPVLRWGVLIGDVLHELNSALDHVAWQFALRNPKRRGKRPSRDTGFPVCTRKGQWEEKWVKAMLQHIGSDDRTFIKSKQPYPAPQGERPETHALAMLRNLARIDKHQVLHTAVMFPLGIDAVAVGRDIGRITQQRIFVNSPVKQSAKFARLWFTPEGGEPDVKMNTHLSLYIGFDGPEYGWMDRGMVFYALRAIGSEVEKTVEQAALRF